MTCLSETIDPAVLDGIYQHLTQLRWSGPSTPAIEWCREGDTAVATFGYFEDATGFVHGYLCQFPDPTIKRRDTEDSIRLRGRIREGFLPMESQVDQIEMPERQPWGVPVTIKIPLAIIDLPSLMGLLACEERIGLKPPSRPTGGSEHGLVISAFGRAQY